MFNKSFTLIEVIVAIFLVTVGIGGVYVLIQRTTAFTPVISARLTAAYLAQGGIENVRNIRDTNWLEREAWDNGIPPGDWATETLLTKFGRTINIATLGNEMVVSVEVTWQERGGAHSVTAQTKLYEWR